MPEAELNLIGQIRRMSMIFLRAKVPNVGTLAAGKTPVLPDGTAFGS